MRLWSLHPSYLDAKGLVACWREGLLARKVLTGDTHGYRNHPQLLRFKAQPDPIAAIDCYLSAILAEADKRGYAFDHRKIEPHGQRVNMTVTEGQLDYEFIRLKDKLKLRDPEKYAELEYVVSRLPNPIFRVVSGVIEPWEKT